MLTGALRSGTTGFADHANRAAGKQSLKDAFAVAKVKKYGTKKNGNLNHYMRTLSIKMERHGFVQHFGVATLRGAGTRTRKQPRELTYSFRTHQFDLPAQPFINKAVDSSGVVPFVMSNVARIRSEEILVHVKKLLEN